MEATIGSYYARPRGLGVCTDLHREQPDLLIDYWMLPKIGFVGEKPMLREEMRRSKTDGNLAC